MSGVIQKLVFRYLFYDLFSFHFSYWITERSGQQTLNANWKLPAAVGRSMCGGDDAILCITDQRPSRCGHGSQDAAVARILCGQASLRGMFHCNGSRTLWTWCTVLYLFYNDFISSFHNHNPCCFKLSRIKLVLHFPWRDARFSEDSITQKLFSSNIKISTTVP